MPKLTKPLSDREIRQRKTPGVLVDGGGLRLRVEVRKSEGGAETITRRWIMRVTVKGLGVREGGLGGYPTVSLAQARDRVAEMRAQARAGIDPFAARAASIDKERAKAVAAAARRLTFREACESYLEAHKDSWRSLKHRQQWENTLLGAPVAGDRSERPKRSGGACAELGDMSVASITTEDVLRALRPIWTATPETGSRTRGRIEVVLDAATARGLRSGENPARWRGHLQRLLPARSKIAPVRHHRALPYAELPGFMSALAGLSGVGARALAFAILTAARSGEVRGMTWGEVDFANRVWIVPVARMKAKREHRVPLSDAALVVLQARQSAGSNPAASSLVFPGSHVGRRPRRGSQTRPALSDMTLTGVLRRMARAKPPSAAAGVTVHGFRSTFRDWCGEQTNFPREVAEAALAHVVADKVEAAYARGDLFEKRRRLMTAWASYCMSGARRGEVVDLGGRRVSRARA